MTAPGWLRMKSGKITLLSLHHNYKSCQCFKLLQETISRIIFLLCFVIWNCLQPSLSGSTGRLASPGWGSSQHLEHHRRTSVSVVWHSRWHNPHVSVISDFRSICSTLHWVKKSCCFMYCCITTTWLGLAWLSKCYCFMTNEWFSEFWSNYK